MKTMKRTRLLSLLLALMLLLGTVAGCGNSNTAVSPAPETSATTSAQTSASATGSDARTIQDFNGDTVSITGHSGKIITVNSVATQIVMMLGGVDAAATAGKGLTYSADSIVGKMCPGVEKLTVWSRDNVNVESVMQMNADVILLDNKDTVASLRNSGIPAAYASVTSPETLMQFVKLVGNILGGDAVTKAESFCQYYQDNIDLVKAQTEKLGDDSKPVVFFARSSNSTVGANSFPDFWITVAGGINAGTKMGLSGSKAEVTVEALMNLNPDIIITEKPEVLKDILSNAQYAGLKAVKDGQVYCAPVGMAVWSMGSAEEAVQVLWAAKLLHPDLFANINVEKESSDFYKTFCGYTITDNELTAILKPAVAVGQ